MNGSSLLRVAHVINGLDVGGAEIMLVRLLEAQRASSVQNHVFSLAGNGPLAEPIRKLGVPLTVAPRRGPVGLATIAGELTSLLRRGSFDVIQAWMYHSNFMSSLVGAATRIPVVWSLHSTGIANGALRPATAALVHLLAPISHASPQRIISCSEVARQVHEARGYSSKKMVVVPNGFDTSQFKPDLVARSVTRTELGVSEDTKLVGLFARFHPQKDHASFLRAAREVMDRVDDVRFVLCGRGITLDNPDLVALADRRVMERCYFLGLRDDVPQLMAGLDLLVSSSSFGEAFPLALGEAMASGVPCVSTDVGDSAFLVGDTGLIVPPNDVSALAAAISTLLSASAEERRWRAAQARERVLSKFDVRVIAANYEAVHRSAARA